jgi:hypothetical protein
MSAVFNHVLLRGEPSIDVPVAGPRFRRVQREFDRRACTQETLDVDRGCPGKLLGVPVFTDHTRGVVMLGV